MKKDIFLSVVTLLITLFFAELALDFFLGDKNKKNIAFQRYMLFSEGDVFKNIGKIFKYHPNSRITSKVFYDVNNHFIEEYSYTVQTNNYGLVQKNDIDQNKQSILFLGDSFTEGSGHEAWINKFEGAYKNYQVINGGIMGAGFSQFELLEEYISKDYNLKKIIVLYIGNNLRRDIFNHNNDVINCLKDHSNCKGYENFYGFNQSNIYEHLNFLKSKRVKNNTQHKKTSKYYRRLVKKYLSELSVFYYPHKFLKVKFYKSKNKKRISNLKSIGNLIEKHETNILFIRLKQKGEILSGNSYNSIYTKNYINQKKSQHFECDFNNDINNFYKYDSHPNKKGYEVLFGCVEDILNKALL
jgi:hypothetical protein